MTNLYRNRSTMALAAKKQLLLQKINKCESLISEYHNKPPVQCVEYDSSDSDSGLPTWPQIQQSRSELRIEERKLNVRLQATQELTSLKVLEYEVNVMVTPPQLPKSKAPSEDGYWREVTAECRVDMVPFVVTFHVHQPTRTHSALSYHNLKVNPVKAAHDKELADSILGCVKYPSDAVEVLNRYSAAHRSRRTTLARLAEKYANVLYMEAMPKGGYLLKCANLLELQWTLENKWSQVAPFNHRLKFELEYMAKNYIKMIQQIHKQLLDPSLETDERTFLMSKIIEICLEAGGEALNVEESDTDNEKLNNTKTTFDNEPEMSMEEAWNERVTDKVDNAADNEIMAPPKTLPKKPKKAADKNGKDNLKRPLDNEDALNAKKPRTESNVSNKKSTEKDPTEAVPVNKNAKTKSKANKENTNPETKKAKVDQIGNIAKTDSNVEKSEPKKSNKNVKNKQSIHKNDADTITAAPKTANIDQINDQTSSEKHHVNKNAKNKNKAEKCDADNIAYIDTKKSASDEVNDKMTSQKKIVNAKSKHKIVDNVEANVEAKKAKIDQQTNKTKKESSEINQKGATNTITAVKEAKINQVKDNTEKRSSEKNQLSKPARNKQNIVETDDANKIAEAKESKINQLKNNKTEKMSTEKNQVNKPAKNKPDSSEKGDDIKIADAKEAKIKQVKDKTEKMSIEKNKVNKPDKNKPNNSEKGDANKISEAKKAKIDSLTNKTEQETSEKNQVNKNSKNKNIMAEKGDANIVSEVKKVSKANKEKGNVNSEKATTLSSQVNKMTKSKQNSNDDIANPPPTEAKNSKAKQNTNNPKSNENTENKSSEPKNTGKNDTYLILKAKQPVTNQQSSKKLNKVNDKDQYEENNAKEKKSSLDKVTKTTQNTNKTDKVTKPIQKFDKVKDSNANKQTEKIISGNITKNLPKRFENIKPKQQNNPTNSTEKQKKTTNLVGNIPTGNTEKNKPKLTPSALIKPKTISSKLPLKPFNVQKPRITGKIDKNVPSKLIMPKNQQKISKIPQKVPVSFEKQKNFFNPLRMSPRLVKKQ